MASWSAPGRVAFPAGLQEFLDERQLEELDLFGSAPNWAWSWTCAGVVALLRGSPRTRTTLLRASALVFGFWISE